jgi:ABC-type transport system involved in multi-copper enzyme maturation permease subunit
MSPRRLGEVFRLEFTHNLRRPLFWVLVLIVGLMALEMSKGSATMRSGNTAVGGSKAWITSEFAVSQLLAMMVSITYAIFIAVAAGMSVIRDEELKVGEMLHATPLTPREYVWGKFLAVVASFLGVLALHLALMVTFNHGVPHGENAEVIGPFVAGNYLRPVLLFALPVLLCVAGTSFAIGTLTRMPILVFALPLAYLLAGMTFLWNWSPAWLSPAVNRILMAVDPTAMRWLNETWLNVDRGVDFYNRAHVGLDSTFWINRLVVLFAGLGAVALAERRFAATLRGTRTVRGRRAAREGVRTSPDAAALASEPAPLAALAMRSRAPGFLAGALEVARVELRELRTHPGLYLFVPMILLQTLGSIVSVGAFDAPLLHTPGTLAAGAMNTLTLLVCMLLLFYAVESLQRERGTGFGGICYATPLRTGALLLGKAAANTVMALTVVTAALIGNVILLAVQGRVPFRIEPFALCWGLLLTPTFVVWTAFVMAVFALTRSRYATYAVCLGAMALTGFFQMRDKMSWVFNWDLWSATRWSDISVFELDRIPLILNRVMVLGLAVFFVALTVRLFPRLEADATRMAHRLRPAALLRGAVGPALLLLVPLAAGTALWLQVEQGFEGARARKLAKDYWKQNVATWAYAPQPAMASVDLDVTLEPAGRRFRVSGHYDLVNPRPEPLRQFSLTGGFGWDSLKWTMNGAPCTPEDRSRLYVFSPEPPLATGNRTRIGFRYQGRYPNGISKNGHGLMEFILPSSAVFTGFSGPTLVPQIGFMSDIGPAEKDRQEPRQYPDDVWREVLPAMLPLAEQAYTTRIRVTVPADFRANANGVLESETERGGKRTLVWVSDRPLKLFNLVAGRWREKRGDGVIVYHHPSHTYNLEEMVQALEGARRWYSTWFAPYPWRDLRLSEFPNLATYAQAPPTNITFSEGVGFLTKSEPKANAAFWVTAHEAAHQWWGNILTPADRPGGEVLSEGMAHFSTILLTEQVKGLEQRISFCRGIEGRYADTRHADAERPLTRIDGSRPGDKDLIYDKGGFVAWMMLQLIGRDPMLAGLREFITLYRDNPDHPVLQDYLAVLRRHAPDTTAYDAFVKQWYFEVVVPEYRLSDARAARKDGAWEVRARIRNAGTGAMPVEVAAVRGTRFAGSRDKKPPYREARVTATLGAGETREIVLRCAFEPERVLADPDFKVLQLERPKATAKVEVEKNAANTPRVAAAVARLAFARPCGAGPGGRPRR